MAGSAAGAAPVVSIVIVTCRRLTELRRCLGHLATHLAASPVDAVEILTVHAPGDDASIAMVRQQHPTVRVLQADRRHMTAPLIAFLDDDAWPQDGWLAALLAAFADPQVLAVGGQVRRADGSRQYGPMVVTALGRPLPLAEDAALPPHLSPTLPGCNMTFRRSALFAVGGFDERLVYHFDDVDISRRLWLLADRRVGALKYVAAAVAGHEPAPGPFRRTLQDRAWYVVSRDSIYFACRHAGRAPHRLAGAVLLQLPKTLRFVHWLLHGRLSPMAFLRCVGKQLAGIVAGTVKGLCCRPILPLQPAPATAAPVTTTYTPRAPKVDDAPPLWRGESAERP
jgi:GT2 family glycosyltransferase